MLVNVDVGSKRKRARTRAHPHNTEYYPLDSTKSHLTSYWLLLIDRSAVVGYTKCYFMSASSSTVSVFKGTAIGIVSCVIWSCAILVMNLLATAFGPMRAAGIELLIAGTFLLAATAARGDLRKISLHSRTCLILCSVFWILNNVLCWVAVSAVANPAELLQERHPH